MAVIGAELLWPLNLRIKSSSGVASLAKDYAYLDSKLAAFIDTPDVLLTSKGTALFPEEVARHNDSHDGRKKYRGDPADRFAMLEADSLRHCSADAMLKQSLVSIQAKLTHFTAKYRPGATLDMTKLSPLSPGHNDHCESALSYAKYVRQRAPNAHSATLNAQTQMKYSGITGKLLSGGIDDATIERAVGLARERDGALPTRQGEYSRIFSIQHERERAVAAKQKKKQEEKLVIKDHLSQVERVLDVDQVRDMTDVAVKLQLRILKVIYGHKIPKIMSASGEAAREKRRNALINFIKHEKRA